jgi:glycosyltransferase involved in cell wall biosynthesis
MRRGESLATHYASADLFLFPSCTETFGNVTLEAMASGLPLVAYNYAAAAQHVQHGTHGLLAAFDRTDEFIAMASELVATHARKPEQFRAMGRDSRLSAEALDWRSVVQQLETLLYSIALTLNPQRAIQK